MVAYPYIIFSVDTFVHLAGVAGVEVCVNVRVLVEV